LAFTPPLPTTSLFPYTTLFRSHLTFEDQEHGSLPRAAIDHLGEGAVLPWHSLRLSAEIDHIGGIGLEHDPQIVAIVDILAVAVGDRKSTRLNSSHVKISYAVFC